MNLIVIKTSICLVLMIVFLIISFTTKDVLNSQLSASLGIISGAFAFKFLSTNNTTTDENN
jgi:hypothetical protein